MNGLLCARPSPGAIRLVVGGHGLLLLLTLFLQLEPDLASQLRAIAWLVTLVSGASFIAALCGLPTAGDFGGRHDR